jgi:two-component system chemotaxis response regulator CheY
MSERTVAALVVDDSPAMRRQLGDLLRRMGVHCDEAVDGAEAWRKLGAARFDVILTDVNMPVIDGLKLIALVRGGGAHRKTPIVVISTEGARADRERGLALGANAWLVKPVQAHEVARAVRKLLGLDEAAA